MQVSYIPPPGSAPTFQPAHPPEPLPYSNPAVEMDTVTSNNRVIILLLSAIYKIGTGFYQCVCLSSDFSGHTGGGGHGEHDHAGAHGGPGRRRRPLHGHCWQPGPLRPGVPSSPDTQALTSIPQHSWWTEEEEERSQQSAQAAAQQTPGPTGAHQCQWLWK